MLCSAKLTRECSNAKRTVLKGHHSRLLRGRAPATSTTDAAQCLKQPDNLVLSMVAIYWYESGHGYWGLQSGSVAAAGIRDCGAEVPAVAMPCKHTICRLHAWTHEPQGRAAS